MVLIILNNFCQKHNTELIVINLESCSPEEEFTQDLISIIHCFSSKLYGLRKYKSQLNQIIDTKETTKV